MKEILLTMVDPKLMAMIPLNFFNAKISPFNNQNQITTKEPRKQYMYCRDYNDNKTVAAVFYKQFCKQW